MKTEVKDIVVMALVFQPLNNQVWNIRTLIMVSVKQLAHLFQIVLDMMYLLISFMGDCGPPLLT